MADILNVDQRIKEGFIGQKMFIIPKNICREIKRNPLIESLYFTDIGFYPHATSHFRERPVGCKQFILIYCVDGEGWVELNSKSHKLIPNSFIIIPKNVSHAYGALPNKFWSIYWMHFSGAQAALLYERYRTNHSQHVVQIPFEERRINLFNSFFSFLESGYSMNNIEYTNISLWQLLSSFIYNQYTIEPSDLHDSSRIDQSILFMKDNLDKSLNVEEIASHFSYSVSHYFNLFKKSTGYPPLHYFNQLKIQKACQYLSFTDLSVKEIGFKLGFQDPLYFSRIFKKLMGTSPIQYRNTYYFKS